MQMSKERIVSNDSVNSFLGHFQGLINFETMASKTLVTQLIIYFSVNKFTLNKYRFVTKTVVWL